MGASRPEHAACVADRATVAAVIAFDGKGFVGTGVTAPALSYLRTIGDEKERVVDLTGIEPVTS